MCIGQRDGFYLQIVAQFGMETFYTSIFTDKTYSGKILTTNTISEQALTSSCIPTLYREQNTARLDVELFTKTALVYRVAGFTAKSGGQAAVETVADPDGPAGAYQ